MVDVNVLAYAFRSELTHHAKAKRFVQHLLDNETFGVSELVLSGFIRLVTNPRAFKPASPLETTLEFAETLHDAPNAVTIHPGKRHWPIFVDLCRRTGATAGDAADAYHAALAIESGCTWVTADLGFHRFPNLRWQWLLDPALKV